ncbi:MerR family transcriptional regulator [Roseicella frigidaeris]|uniref:hypothetical protein n=1 Tax=Roseicella frigidaeris TaxID=2230885 RepID=UPI000FDD4872|nr:hypothetical protein [Roseicella frigidaeris]
MPESPTTQPAAAPSSSLTHSNSPPPDPTPDIVPKQIPAATFAKLVGRGLRTLRNWDQAGLTRPEMRRSRRYYGADDLAAVLSCGPGRTGPREGSPIKYIAADWDSGAQVMTGFTQVPSSQIAGSGPTLAVRP